MKNGEKAAIKKTADVLIENTSEALARDEALLAAFLKEDIEEVKRLLKPENGVRGANANMLDQAGRSLCHLAHRWGWKEMKSILHKHGGRIICRTSSMSGKCIYRSKQLER
jgi:hypothetical protein